MNHGWKLKGGRRGARLAMSDEAAAALAAGDWIVFGAIGDVALVDLDEIFQQASVGSTVARRSFCSISQAVFYEPRPSCAWSCKAEAPFQWLATA